MHSDKPERRQILVCLINVLFTSSFSGMIHLSVFIERYCYQVRNETQYQHDQYSYLVMLNWRELTELHLLLLNNK